MPNVRGLSITKSLTVLRSAAPRSAASQFTTICRKLVRLGQPVFAFTYSSAVLSISGSTLSLIGWIDGTVVFHFVPSHWTSEIPP